VELQAFRRMTSSPFGTLMSVEPAIAVLIGVVVLGQVPALWQVAGMALVVAAGSAWNSRTVGTCPCRWRQQQPDLSLGPAPSA
jgi:threonine/homoserine efflux transporter RhtA